MKKKSLQAPPERLSNAHKAHRQAFRRFVLEKAKPWHREHLGRLYDCWEKWNEEYFGSELIPPYILLAEPSNPRRYGDCGPVSGFGGYSQIRIRPSLLTGTHPNVKIGKRYAVGRALLVQDILLHEMIHQWQDEITGKPETSYHGHGPGFRDKCNEIGAKLHLEPVRDMKRRNKDKDLPSCSYWPHNVRPPAYYKGAYSPPDHAKTSLRQTVAVAVDTALDELAAGNLQKVRSILQKLAKIVHAKE